MSEIKFGSHIVYTEITIDEFSSSKKLIFKRKNIMGEFFIKMSNEDLVHLEFTFRNVRGEDFIIFRCEKSDYKLKKGDSIYFLFESGDILEFLLVNKSYSVPTDSKMLENICQITVPELDILINKKFLKWKIRSIKERLEISGGFYMNYERTDYPKCIMEIANEYKVVVAKRIDNYKPLYERIYEIQNISDKIDNRREKIPQEIMDAVWRRDEGKCVECGSNENLEFDHIIPISKGGANTYRNIQLLCEECNRKKSNRLG